MPRTISEQLLRELHRLELANHDGHHPVLWEVSCNVIIDTFPRAVVPDEASFRIVSTFLVAKYIENKMRRECNLGQVNFIDREYKDAADLPVKQVPGEDSTCCVQNFHKNSTQ